MTFFSFSQLLGQKNPLALTSDISWTTRLVNSVMWPTYKPLLLWVAWLQSPLGRSSGSGSGKCRPWTHPSALASASSTHLQLKRFEWLSLLLYVFMRGHAVEFAGWRTHLFPLRSCVSRVVCTECRNNLALGNCRWFVWTSCKKNAPIAELHTFPKNGVVIKRGHTSGFVLPH